MSHPDAREFWNQRFSAEGYLFGTEPNRFLASQAHLLRTGMTALSVADGEGRNSVWLAEQGLHVTAVEISPVAVDKARRLAEGRDVSVRFHEANVLDWDFGEERYDLVAAIFIQFAGPAERARIFSAIERALEPGGWLVLQGYTPKQLEYRTGGPSSVENLYTEELLRTAFPSLEITHLRAHEETIEEGAGHKGLSALIELVARRPAA